MSNSDIFIQNIFKNIIFFILNLIYYYNIDKKETFSIIN